MRHGSYGGNNGMQVMTMQHPVQLAVKKGDTSFWYSGPDGSKATSNAFKLAKKIVKSDY